MIVKETRVCEYYRVLGVRSTATDAEIREVYIRLVKSSHPDRLGTSPEPTEWKAANERLAAFNEAYAVLGDPVKRREYDATCPPDTLTPDPGEQPTPERPAGRKVLPGRTFMIVLGESLRDRASVIKALLDDRIITGYYSYLSNCIFCTSWKTADEISNCIVNRCAPKGGAVFVVTGVSGDWSGRLPRNAWEFLEKSIAAAPR